MIYNGSMSNEEAFRLNGTLEDDRIEELLTIESQFADMRGIAIDIAIDIEEARAGFPSEDFLTTALKETQVLFKNTRGDNRVMAGILITTLEEIQSSVAQSVEYGAEKLEQALEACRAQGEPEEL